ncbi:hypothetical protein D3C71_978620 [compost metagenome]
MEISPEEFLYNIENKAKKEVDIFNDSFDELLASGEFQEIPDNSAGAGDPRETFDDFFARAQHFKSEADNSIPIGIESEEQYDEIKAEENFENNKKSSADKEQAMKELKEAMEKYGLTEEDLDIFETGDE